ncbi:MAG TPA: autotransporter-associated beta strand repeat-containing protein [Candidatus Sulfotelmatobacter sp.]|nr:autotransporter-associated beta strand repeat-containing protein [Candidatus Sulfotelmatobacter sp.]
MNHRISSFEFVRKVLSAAAILAAAFFVTGLLDGTRAQAQTYESWTATADNFTNGADWNPAITGATTDWPNDNNGLSVLYRPLLTNGGTIYYVGPTEDDPFDPNWTNTVDQIAIGPASGASASSGTNTFIMMGGSLTLGDSGGADLAVGGYSVNSISNNAVFTMTGGLLDDTNDTASSSDASLYVATGSNAPATVNLDGGTANFNNVYIAGRGVGVVNVDGADVNINGDSYGNSSSGGTPAYYISIGYGSSGTLSANGEGAGTLNLISGELDLTNAEYLSIGGRCNSATLNVSGGELDTPKIQWGFGTNGKITNMFNLSGGLVNVGSGGLTHDGTESNRLVISGGTFSTLFGQSWSDDGSLTVTITNVPGPGIATFAPSQGASIKISSVMRGPGSFNAAGPGQVILAGANAYTGSTMVSGGTLTLENTIESANIVVAGGATFDLTSLPIVLTLTSQTVSNSSSTVTLNGSINTGTGTVSLTYNGVIPSFTVTSGTTTLSSNTKFYINNTGSPLAIGSYPIVTAGNGGSVAVSGSLPAVTVNGAGIAAGTTASLALNDGGLDLVVSPPVNTTPTNIVISVTVNQLTLTWPMDHTGWELQAQTNSLSTGLSTNWADVSGSTTTNQMVIPVAPNNGSVFYRLVYPPQ